MPSNKLSGSFGRRPGSAVSLGVPTLKDQIHSYPAMLLEPSTCSRKQERLQPRRGAHTVRVVSVRRNVRMYTPDLVKSAAGWASRPPHRVTHALNTSAQSHDWEWVAPPSGWHCIIWTSPEFPSPYRHCIIECVYLFYYHIYSWGWYDGDLWWYYLLLQLSSLLFSLLLVSLLFTRARQPRHSPLQSLWHWEPAIAGKEQFCSLMQLKWG